MPRSKNFVVDLVTYRPCGRCLGVMTLDSYYVRKSGIVASICKQCTKDVSAEWSKSNPDRRKENYSSSYANNIEKRKAFDRTEERKKNVRKYNRKHRMMYPQKNAHKQKLREERKKRATPTWLSCKHIEDIKMFYEHARDCSLVSGEKYHVDHIIPIKGKNICGLHVPWNLQVLPAYINISKSNKVDF